MPKPRSHRVRFQTGQNRAAVKVRGKNLPRARKRQVGPLTVQVLEYHPPLEHPGELGHERIWAPVARVTST